MYNKYYKLQVFFLCIGGALMLLAFFGVVPLICKVFAGICFILVTFFYYQIMSMLAKVTDITAAQVWLGSLSHLAIMAATYLIGNRALFHPLLIFSFVTRTAMGIFAIDAQMYALCKELDANFLHLALKEQRQNEHSLEE